MLINRSCKTSIVKPSPDCISRVARYLPHRSRTLENLQQQLFPEDVHHKPGLITSPMSCDPEDYKHEQNILAQMELANAKSLPPITTINRGLINPFSNKSATSEQSADLLAFRSIGSREFLLKTATSILRNPSVQAPARKHRLQTFTERQPNKQKVSQLERDRRLILSCMRKKMKWSNTTGKPIDTPGEQLLELPVALCDHMGQPNKGQNSYATKALQTCYKTTIPPVFYNQFPPEWMSQCCILEGMFLINTNPLGTHLTYGDYANFLMMRHIVPHFRQGCNEVYVIFDSPGKQQNKPKYFEHQRRDEIATVTTDHSCSQFDAAKNMVGK